VVLFAAVLLVVYHTADPETRAALAGMFTIFVSIVLEALPFLLLGSLVGGFIEVFVSRERVANILSGRKTTAIFIAAAAGCVFPVCECAIVPVVRRLLRKGVPFPAAVAYLLAGPIVNPLVAASTAVAYKGDMTVVALRVGLGYAVAVTVALVLGRFFPGHDGVRPEVFKGEEDEASCCHGSSHSKTSPTPLGRLLEALTHGADDTLAVGRFLIIGALFAGVLRGLVAQDALMAGVAANPFTAVGVMMVLAVVLNLCLSLIHI